jgi:hypothetical protein
LFGLLQHLFVLVRGRKIDNVAGQQRQHLVFQSVPHLFDLFFSFAFGFLLPLFGRQDFFLLVFEHFEGAVLGLGGQGIGQPRHRTPGFELPFPVRWKQRSAVLRRDLGVQVWFVVPLFGVHWYGRRPQAQLDGALHGRLGRPGSPDLFRAQGRSGKGVGDVVHGGGAGESSPHASTGVSSTGWHITALGKIIVGQACLLDGCPLRCCCNIFELIFLE